jgi:SAM-dependent methyltransferase
MFLRNWLEIKYLKGIDPDDPRTTELRRRAIHENPFLYQIYCSWYQLITESIPPGCGQIVELGSGAGFLCEHIPGLITSEMFFLNGMCILMDGQHMPFADGSLKAIALTNVLHHIPSSRHFFSEAARVIRPGGVISMIEPWGSPWSKLIYTCLHHEPFDSQSVSWEFPSNGPLSGANDALPWIIFQRDRVQFEREFPIWHVKQIIPFMPFAYLFSGGVSLRPLMPGWSYRPVRWFESLFLPFMPHLAMFAHIVLVRKSDDEMD